MELARTAADHISHMANASGEGCPPSHPVRVPSVTFVLRYPVQISPEYTLSSGRLRSMHADYWNTWDQSELENLTSRCLNDPQETCPGSIKRRFARSSNQGSVVEGRPDCTHPKPSFEACRPSISWLERIPVRGPRVGDARILRRRKRPVVDPSRHAIDAEEQGHGHRHPRDPDHEDDEPPSHEGFDPSRSRGWPPSKVLDQSCPASPRSVQTALIFVRIIAARPTGRSRPREAPVADAPPPARCGGSLESGTRS